MRKSKLKKQLKAEVIELATAINEDRGQINEKATYSYVDTFKTITAERLTDLEEIADKLQNHVYTHKCECHSNTQKENKNATETAESGKKGHLETIVTNEMFNDELEKLLSNGFIQDHPAFILLNKDLDSEIIENLIRAKLKSKGEHYSPNGDRYSNFKRLNGISFKKKSVPERIENFMEKHEIWIEDYQAGDVNGTLLDLIESCVDVLCYKLLLDVYLKFNGEVSNG